MRPATPASNPRPAPRRGRTATAPRTAFTLVELLVVVAILALLVSILVPSMTAAKHSVRAAICESNLHQISSGFANTNAITNPKYPHAYPQAASWPSIPINLIGTSNIFKCPESDMTSASSGLQFMSQAGFFSPFAPSDQCMVRVGPQPAGGYGIPATPEGATDYCFEDITTQQGSDMDHNDCICRIWTNPLRGEVIAVSAGYRNQLWINGQVALDLPNGDMTLNPPMPFPVIGLTSYGYNTKAYFGSTLIALDYDQPVCNTGEDMYTHLNASLRHANKVNVLSRGGAVTRMGLSELDPTIQGNAGRWGN